MSNDLKCVVAGFGGQGSLFAGKVIATAGLAEDREVSWMPSTARRCAAARPTAR